MWAPLSFIFLVVGILLGFEAAFSVRGSAAADPYDLGLTVSRTGDTLTLRWNRSAPAIRQARRGAVYIEENDRRKSRDLQPDELQNGAVVYPPSGGRVRFRLEVFPNEKDSISETVDWRE